MVSLFPSEHFKHSANGRSRYYVFKAKVWATFHPAVTSLTLDTFGEVCLRICRCLPVGQYQDILAHSMWQTSRHVGDVYGQKLWYLGGYIPLREEDTSLFEIKVLKEVLGTCLFVPVSLIPRLQVVKHMPNF